MANDHDHHADGIAKPTRPSTEGRALAMARDPRRAPASTAMLTKSEIALLAVAVLGTLAASADASVTGAPDPGPAGAGLQRSGGRIPGRRAAYKHGHVT